MAERRSTVNEQVTEMPWVILRLRNQNFGIPITDVAEMVTLPQVVPLPQAPDYVRGMITLRGRAIPLVCLRARLGMPTSAEEKREMVAMLRERAAEHTAWLEELEASVREQRTFNGALDHHACTFGRWYDSYRTDDLLLRSLLGRFEEPHRRVHEVARRVRELEGEDSHGRALALIEHTRQGELHQMLQLFESAIQLIEAQQREIAVVLERGGRLIAVSVDAVEAVDHVREANDDGMEVLATAADVNLLHGVGRIGREGELVLMLELDHLFVDPATLHARQTAENGGRYAS